MRQYDGNNGIIAYRYWLNQECETAVNIDVKPENPFIGNFFINIDKLGLNHIPSFLLEKESSNSTSHINIQTVHTLNLHFKDCAELWSPIQIDTFFHNYSINVDNSLTLINHRSFKSNNNITSFDMSECSSLY